MTKSNHKGSTKLGNNKIKEEAANARAADAAIAASRSVKKTPFKRVKCDTSRWDDHKTATAKKLAMKETIALNTCASEIRALARKKRDVACAFAASSLVQLPASNAPTDVKLLNTLVHDHKQISRATRADARLVTDFQDLQDAMVSDAAGKAHLSAYIVCRQNGIY
jgi:hypothetical protein